jgi:NADH/NAD ratio-sensing transcriptional regulator Rex
MISKKNTFDFIDILKKYDKKDILIKYEIQEIIINDIKELKELINQFNKEMSLERKILFL